MSADSKEGSRLAATRTRPQNAIAPVRLRTVSFPPRGNPSQWSKDSYNGASRSRMKKHPSTTCETRLLLIPLVYVGKGMVAQTNLYATNREQVQSPVICIAKKYCNGKSLATPSRNHARRVHVAAPRTLPQMGLLPSRLFAASNGRYKMLSVRF